MNLPHSVFIVQSMCTVSKERENNQDQADKIQSFSQTEQQLKEAPRKQSGVEIE